MCFVEEKRFVCVAMAVMAQKELLRIGTLGYHCCLTSCGMHILTGIVFLVVSIGGLVIYGKGSGTLAAKRFSKGWNITCVRAVSVGPDWDRGERNEWLWQRGVTQKVLARGFFLKKEAAAGYAMLQGDCLDSKRTVFVDDL